MARPTEDPVRRAWEAYYRRYPTIAMRKQREREMREEAERERQERTAERWGA